MDIYTVLGTRICVPFTFSGAPEDAIKTLLYQNVIVPEHEARKLPFDGFKTEVATGETIDLSLKHENLAEVIERLCTENGLALSSNGGVITLSYA